VHFPTKIAHYCFLDYRLRGTDARHRAPTCEIDPEVGRRVGTEIRFLENRCAASGYHPLVPFAAYGTLLREPRRALHARIADVLESQFTEVAESQPELLARHCTEAGLIEKAAGLWGKAGQRSLARSALVEATGQFTRALAQMASLPGTAALRREQIKLQVALANALGHTKGFSAAGRAFVQARLYIEQAEALGEPPEDPLLLFSVLYGFWVEPAGVPPENWLPINREDQGISLMLRLYAPDLAKAKTWKASKAQLAS
jgi:hypothetical protein